MCESLDHALSMSKVISAMVVYVEEMSCKYCTCTGDEKSCKSGEFNSVQFNRSLCPGKNSFVVSEMITK